MNHKVTQAKRLIEAFVALTVGCKAQVHWGGVGGLTSEGVIHLPMPKTGDAAEIALLSRLAVHEGGHMLETTPGFGERLTQEELTIFNMLEDPRMEMRQGQRWPGASLVLSRGLDEMLQSIEDNLDETLAAAPERAVHLDMLMRGFLAVAPHGPMVRRSPGIRDRIAPHINDAQRAAIEEAVAKLPNLSSSLDAEAAARAFLARLREPEPPPPQEEPDEPQEQRPEQTNDEQPANDGEAAQGPQPGETEADSGDGAAQRPEANEQGSGNRDGSDTVAPTEGKPTNSDGADGGDSGGEIASDACRGGDAEGAGQDADGAGNTDPQGDDGGRGPTAGESPDASGDNSGAAGDGESQSKDSAGQQPGADSSGSSGAGEAAASQPGHEAGTAAMAGEPFDLGQLLRDAHVTRYGPPDRVESAAAAEQAAAPLREEELDRVAAVLAQADSPASLEELVEASLTALSASEANKGGEDAHGNTSDGAGMSLTVAPTAPAMLVETRLQGVQSRLVTVLQRELQDKRRRPTRAAYGGGRVMSQRFWRLGTLGDTKVFVQRRPAGGIDAAATVLLDTSDSMDKQLAVAAEVTMAFSLALQRLGVRTRVARFPGTDTVTETIQRFGESARNCVQRCEELTASGGTPIGAAVALETPSLLLQRKLKNVLVVVTDDKPADISALTAALERADEQDILVVGVGIGCDIRRWIPTSVAVQGVNELPDALARLFRENISEKLAA